MQKLILLVLLALAVRAEEAPAAPRDSSAVSRVQLALIPFNQISTFKHAKWDLKEDIPAFISRQWPDGGVVIIPFERTLEAIDKLKLRAGDLRDPAKLVLLAKELGVTHLVCGDILNFHISKRTAVLPEVGGYKQYNAVVEIRISFFDKDLEEKAYETLILKDVLSRGLKFNPPGRISGDEDDYLRLEKIDFGSQVFMRTVIGEAMLRFMQEFSDKVEAYVNFGAETPDTPGERTGVLVEAKILQLDGNDAYINAGRDDRIRNGDVFDVYTRGKAIFDPDTKQKLGYTEKKVGKVKVAQVKAAHFSRVRIIEGLGELKVMDVVRIR